MVVPPFYTKSFFTRHSRERSTNPETAPVWRPRVLPRKYKFSYHFLFFFFGKGIPPPPHPKQIKTMSQDYTFWLRFSLWPPLFSSFFYLFPPSPFPTRPHKVQLTKHGEEYTPPFFVQVTPIICLPFNGVTPRHPFLLPPLQTFFSPKLFSLRIQSTLRFFPLFAAGHTRLAS